MRFINYTHKNNNNNYYCYLIIVITLISRCGSVEVKAELNETESNEVTSNNVDHNWMDDKPDLTHPHSVKDKPSKFDLDTSGSIYTDSNSPSTTSPSESLTSTLPSPTNPNAIDSKTCDDLSVKCFRKDLEFFLDTAQTKNVLNVSDSLQIVKRKNFTAFSTRESLFDKVHRFAKNYVMKINLNKNLIDLRQPRTFFGSKYFFFLRIIA